MAESSLNGKKTWGAISPFPKVFSKDLYCSHIKTKRNKQTKKKKKKKPQGLFGRE